MKAFHNRTCFVFFLVFLLQWVLFSQIPAFGQEIKINMPDFGIFPKDIRRLGIFPGSFDPVHRGHLEVARVACDRLELDVLLFIPNLVNPRKPGLSPLDFRIDLIEKGIQEFGDPRLFVLPKEIIVKATSGDSSITPAQRLLDAAVSMAPEARVFQILGSDSLPKIIQFKGMPKPGDRLKVVVFERKGDRSMEALDQSSLRKWIQEGILVRIQSDVGDLSSTEVRNAFSNGVPSRVIGKLPGSLYRKLIIEGAYGLASQTIWPETLRDTATIYPSQAKGERKREILLFPMSLETSSIPGQSIEFERIPPSEAVRRISFTSAHTLGNVRQYLEERLPSTGLKLLSFPAISVELFAGNRKQLLNYLSSIASRSVELVLKREYVTSGFFLASLPDGSFRIILGGDIYGETRLLHTEAMIAAALSSAGRNSDDYCIVRPKPMENQFEISRGRFQDILADVAPGSVDAAIIGYAKGISDDLANRYDLWKTFPRPVVFSDGKISYNWIKSRKKKFGESWVPPRYPEKFNSHHELPHNQYSFRTIPGGNIRVLITRNVYGDQTSALIDVLVKEKGINRIFLFGNAGSLDSRLQIGAIVKPVQVSSAFGLWRSFPGSFYRRQLPWLKSACQEVSIFSVFSPIQETASFVQELKNSGAKVVDVEMTHFLNSLETLRKQGYDVKAAALLIISDQPGKEHTLSDLFQTETFLSQSRTTALDLIYNELQIAGPP